jgi:hypothetical protein
LITSSGLRSLKSREFGREHADIALGQIRQELRRMLQGRIWQFLISCHPAPEHYRDGSTEKIRGHILVRTPPRAHLLDEDDKSPVVVARGNERLQAALADPAEITRPENPVV